MCMMGERFSMDSVEGIKQNSSLYLSFKEIEIVLVI